ncbi:MAG: S8 family peptidase [Bdellovibrionales bacterium]
MRKSVALIGLSVILSVSANAEEYIIKFKNNVNPMQFFSGMENTPKALMENLYVVDVDHSMMSQNEVLSMELDERIEYVQPNFKMAIPELNIEAGNVAISQILNSKQSNGVEAAQDNPNIPARPANPGNGADPEFGNQWGMNDIGVKEAWNQSGTKGSDEIVVAVIDTGVDYVHEDLVYNMWRNEGEIAGNNIDDDGNGFVDDVVGWDFVSNDNKPWDLYTDPLQLLLGGGNPGHGTHCAGNVAARANNGKGVVGVAPNVRIMAMRFLSEKGQGTTSGAIQSIKYAVDNGAHILSNSWGSVGEGSDQDENKALRDAIQYAQDKGILFVAAAGNGKQGKGYNNDTDSQPAYPASYDHDIIVSVAAIDVEDNLGPFSNWGKRTVDIGAPGVKVFSTVPDSKYADTVIDMFGLTVYWDGTSMATPHVAGAAALYLSANPTADWTEIKEALLSSVTKVQTLNGKTSSDGKLNVLQLMQR